MEIQRIKKIFKFCWLGRILRTEAFRKGYGGDGFVHADTGKVMDEKERKEFDIEPMKNEFLAVETMKTILMVIAMLICVIVMYIPV